MGEIYKVTNNISGKIYIGKTKRKTRDRWLEHVRDAKNYPLKNIPLHKAIIKYGADNFPIRKIDNKVECDFNKAFYEVLFTNKSISQIERELNIHFNGLRYIVLGKRRRELTSDYITPMREHIEANKQIWIKQNGGKVNEICTSA